MRTPFFICAALVVGFTGPSASGLDSLQQKLDAKRDEFAAKAPAAVLNSQKEALAELKASGIEQKARKVGDQAPGFSLKNPQGDEVALADLLKKGPVVLTWYRGGWCPYCNIALTALRDANDEIRAQGATLVALTPELPDSTSASVKEKGLPFEVLTDLNLAVGDQYGLVFPLDPETAARYEEHFKLSKRNGLDAGAKLPLAATYVIAPDGRITYAFVDVDYKKRAEPVEILKALASLKKGQR